MRREQVKQGGRGIWDVRSGVRAVLRILCLGGRCCISGVPERLFLVDGLRIAVAWRGGGYRIRGLRVAVPRPQ